MSLTDDWKERKLERAKSYWVKVQGYNPEPMVLMIDNNFIDFEYNIFDKNDNVNLCVLDKCDYEELQAMKEQLNKEGTWYTEIAYKKLQKENDFLAAECKRLSQEDTDLRELLKECKFYIEKDFECIRANGWTKEGVFNDLYDLLTRINTAIGESEECLQ